MGDKLISGVEWWKKEGKWTCSLICLDEVFSQVWLESAVHARAWSRIEIDQNLN